MLKHTTVLGIKITISSEEEILEFIKNWIKEAGKKKDKLIIFTPNPEQISAAQTDPSLKSLLNQADISLPDGWGVIWGSKLLGHPIDTRISGVDFMQKLIELLSKRPVKSGFFGAQEGVAIEAANCLQEKWPNMAIGYASDVFDKEKMIHSDIDVLFVALGFPKQEEWILQHKNEVPAKILMSVGGSFDLISGKIKRAPKFMQESGAEWLFRLARQPRRVFRQARLLHFSGLIFQEALTSRLKNKKNN